MPNGRIAVLALALAAGWSVVPTAYAEWQTLIQSKEQKLDIERPISGADGNPALWSRLTFTEPVSEMLSGQAVRSVELLNSFDCRQRQVSTLERIYRDEGGRKLKHERAESPKKTALAGVADEYMFETACKVPLAWSESRETKEKKEAAVIKADHRSHQEGRIMLVADEHAAKPAAAAPAPAPAPAARPPEKAQDFSESNVDLHGRVQLPAIRKPINPEQIPPATKKPSPQDYAPVTRSLPGAKPKLEASPLAEIPKRVPPPIKPSYAAQGSKPLSKVKGHVHWSYEGETGPENWAKLSRDYAACGTGTRQSPIDIRDGVKVDLPPIRFDYLPSTFSIVDNGHTVQINPSGGNSFTLQGRRYELVQFHFHKPSEERINGRAYDLVAHLVHKDEDGRLAVVAVLFDRGTDNPLIQTLWNHLPLEQNKEVLPVDAPIDLSMILPRDQGYYTYMGSLTTPPCTEGVLWLVMKTPMLISDYQVAVFGHLYKRNIRPIQPVGKRLIKESR